MGWIGRKQKIGITPKQQIALLFLIGVIGGTIYSNLAGQERILGGFSFSGILDNNMNMIGSNDSRTLLHLVFGQRIAETIVLWIAGMTAISVPAVCLLVIGYGFVSGFLLSACVMQKGILGIFFFWGMLLPQYLVYVPVWYHMALWAYQDSKKARLTGFMSAVFFVGAASVAESYLNPIIMNFVFQFLPEKINF